MGFWGIEVKPGRPYPYHHDNVSGKLRVTQATLGLGSSKDKSIHQCSKGHKSPIFLCSLLPNKTESCSLDLEFDDDEELVAFSVIGPRSIHLSGYFVPTDGDTLREEYEFDSGEDFSETESDTDDSSEYDTEDEYGDDFMDDDEDLEMFRPSNVPNSGVVIEEITDDVKPTKKTDQSKSQMKNRASDSMEQNDSQRQIVLKSSSSVPVLESEDEDGFPISPSHASKAAVVEPKEGEEGQVEKEKTKETKKKIAKDDNEITTSKKRKDKSANQDGQLERKAKKKKQQKEKSKDEKSRETGTGNVINNISEDEIQPEEENDTDLQICTDRGDHSQSGLDTNVIALPSDNGSEKKKKNKKNKKNKKKDKKKQETEGGPNSEPPVSSMQDSGEPTLVSGEKQNAAKPSKVRTWANGLVVEELAMGKPDGKRAYLGNQVSVHYIGKLKKNGKIVDSNIGRAPFKFRLGVGQVIKGWDVGIDGMRVGDKRRVTIPPSMGYGSQGAGGKIPPNSWLVFDVELVNVR